MIREYEIRFTKKNKNGKLGKTEIMVTLVSSKDEKNILANEDKILSYAFAKYKKKSTAKHRLEDFEVTNIKVLKEIRGNI